MAIKSKIQRIRKEAGLTQGDLASAAGISRQAFTAIESGKSVPSTTIALRLARKLKTTVEDLFWLDDDSDNLVQAELIGESNEAAEGTRMQLVQFGSRLFGSTNERGLIGESYLESGGRYCRGYPR